MNAHSQAIFQIITIAAIVVGPILALMAQRKLDSLRDAEKRKRVIFRDLLMTRAIPVSIQHVQALNLIELEFYPRGRKNSRVVDAWRIYSDHLNQPLIVNDPPASNAWDVRRLDLIVDLLYEMAQRLGYDFDKVMIKRDAYHPKGLTDMENEQAALRQAAVQVFAGKEPLRVRIDNPPTANR